MKIKSFDTTLVYKHIIAKSTIINLKIVSIALEIFIQRIITVII